MIQRIIPPAVVSAPRIKPDAESMGFKGTSELSISILELDDGLTFPALDGHQVAQSLRCGPPARALGLADDPLRDRFHMHLSLRLPATGAEMDISQIGERRPGDMGQHLPVVWTAAFVHHQ
jgi:hypothetical protein